VLVAGRFELARKRREALEELVDGGVRRARLSTWLVVLEGQVVHSHPQDGSGVLGRASATRHLLLLLLLLLLSILLLLLRNLLLVLLDALQFMRDDSTNDPHIIIPPTPTSSNKLSLLPLPIPHSSRLLHQLPQRPNFALNRIAFSDNAL
jgi:hypothetical protein